MHSKPGEETTLGGASFPDDLLKGTGSGAQEMSSVSRTGGVCSVLREHPGDRVLNARGQMDALQAVLEEDELRNVLCCESVHLDVSDPSLFNKGITDHPILALGGFKDLGSKELWRSAVQP